MSSVKKFPYAHLRGDICCNIAIRLAMAFENNTFIRFSHHCEIYENSNLFKSH